MRRYSSAAVSSDPCLGGRYEKGPDWASFVITDGRLVTGQKPASSTARAQALLKPLA